MGHGRNWSGKVIQSLWFPTEFLVVTPYEFGEAAWDRIAIQWNERIVARAPGELLTNLVSDFHQRAEDLQLDLCPVRFFTVLPILDSHPPCLIAGIGYTISEIRSFEEFFDIAKAVRPPPKLITGERSGTHSCTAVARSAISSEQAIQI